jgi:hypothetical protein
MASCVTVEVAGLVTDGSVAYSSAPTISSASENIIQQSTKFIE